MYRRRSNVLKFLLVHPGRPFWAKRDKGAWSIPKGEYSAPEDALATAVREIEEETGMRPPGPYLALGEIVQAGWKNVTAWAVEGDFDPAKLQSNTFALEWPPRSGREVMFPEVDRAAWFSQHEAEDKILAGQRPLIARLVARLSGGKGD